MIGPALLVVGASLASIPADTAEARFPATIEMLRGHVRALSRPVVTYHYATRARLGLPDGPVAPDYPLLARGFAARVERFWDLSIPVRPLANASGLYLATDPVISRTFGGVGDGWALLQVRLNAGFRFVDAREHDDARLLGQVFPLDVQRELHAAGCSARLPAALLVAAEVQACREVAVAVLRALGADGILYSFAAYPFRECRPRVSGGFILLTASAVTEDAIRILTADSGGVAEAVSDRDAVHQMFLRAHAAGSSRDTPWPRLGRTRPASFGVWMRQNLFGCGTYPEDAPPQTHIAAALNRAWDALAQSMDSADARYAFARELLDDERHRARAIEEFETALTLDPDHVPSLEMLAWTLATAGDPALRDGPRARPLAERLVALTHYRERQAWSRAYRVRASHVLVAAAAASGDFDRAVDYAHQAWETSEQLASERADDEVYRWLADRSRAYLAAVRNGHPITHPPNERLPLIPAREGDERVRRTTARR